CRGPVQVFNILQGTMKFEIGLTVVVIRNTLILLKTLNCALNPLLYCNLHDRFRGYLIKIYRRIRRLCPWLCPFRRRNKRKSCARGGKKLGKVKHCATGEGLIRKKGDDNHKRTEVHKGKDKDMGKESDGDDDDNCDIKINVDTSVFAEVTIELNSLSISQAVSAPILTTTSNDFNTNQFNGSDFATIRTSRGIRET